MHLKRFYIHQGKFLVWTCRKVSNKSIEDMPSSAKPKWSCANKREMKMISFSYTPSSHICSKCFKTSLSCPCMADPPSMVVQRTPIGDGILWSTFQASSMLAHFTYMSIKLLPASTFEFHPLSMICSWTNLPSCSAIVLAHAFNIPQK